ncbi:2TM domain-containing protein [bacterium]|nr:MAG: 2TM domain-containing protein [bacterium]
MGMQRFYDEDEAKEVLLRASDIHAQSSARLSRDELVKAAAEVGISEEALVKAEEQTREARLMAEFDKGMRAGFYSHLLIYLLVVGFLLVLNLMTSPREPWVIYPALGWGIGLICHTVSTFGRKSDWYQTSFRMWQAGRKEVELSPAER